MATLMKIRKVFESVYSVIAIVFTGTVGFFRTQVSTVLKCHGNASDLTSSMITMSQSAAPPKPVAVMVDKSVITMEFQRQKAKELREYFKQKKLDEANQGPFFGFIAKNEISNGK